MQYRRVGSSDLSVSALGFGTVEFGGKTDQATANRLVSTARHSGITLFDTGDNYNAGRSETMLGQALGAARKDVVISTKFTGASPPFVADGSYEGVLKACEGSLKRLNTDYIDLYTMHHPDPDTPIGETLAALEKLVKQGKARYVACSNFGGWQVVEALQNSAASRSVKFIANQVEWNLLKRHAESEIVPACREYGVGIMPFYPIASGLLSGRYLSAEDFPESSRLYSSAFYRKVLSEINFKKVRVLAQFARERGRTLLELAIGWLLGWPEVSSILIGASSPEQLSESIHSSGWRLSAEERTEVDELLSMVGNSGEVPFNRDTNLL
jgi:aryl-alcohol dehydrogenase-like predicted oxidoreductase